MKASLKFLIPCFVITVALTPFTRAANEPATVQVPVPAAPDAGDSADAVKGKGGKGGRGEAREELKALKEKLNLTADQEKQITSIWKSHADELKGARGDRAKMAEVMKQQRTEVRAVLTPDQQKTYDEMTPRRGPGKKAKKEV